MDIIQELSMKATSDHLSQKKLKKRSKLPSELSQCKKICKFSVINSGMNCCSYCSKIFIHSKYLVKHILRRHPNEFPHLFEVTVSNNARGTPLASNSKVVDEVQNLSKTIMTVKADILTEMQSVKENVTNTGMNIINEQNLSPPKNSVQLNYVRFEEFNNFKVHFDHLNNKVDKLEERVIPLEIHKCQSKDQLENISKDIDKLIKDAVKPHKKELEKFKEGLDQYLASSHKDIYNEMANHNSNIESLINKLNQQYISEAQKLRTYVDSCITGVHSTDGIKKQLEEFVHCYLSNIYEKQKNKSKCSKLIPLVSKEQSFMQSTCLSSKPAKSTSSSLKGQNNCSITLLSDGEKNCSTSSLSKEQSNCSSKSNPKQLPAQMKNTECSAEQVTTIRKQLPAMVEDKMQTFDIAPQQELLSNSDYVAKNQLLLQELQQQQAIHPNFQVEWERLDIIANEKVKHLLNQYNKNQKCQRKIRFLIDEVENKGNCEPCLVNDGKNVSDRLTNNISMNSTEEECDTGTKDINLNNSNSLIDIPRPLPRRNLQISSNSSSQSSSLNLTYTTSNTGSTNNLVPRPLPRSFASAPSLQSLKEYEEKSRTISSSTDSSSSSSLEKDLFQNVISVKPVSEIETSCSNEQPLLCKDLDPQLAVGNTNTEHFSNTLFARKQYNFVCQTEVETDSSDSNSNCSLKSLSDWNSDDDGDNITTHIK